MTLPARVLDAIATRTGVDPRGLTRRATWSSCRHCSTPILRGLDADMCAFEARADPHRITPLGELQALTTGLSTYDLDGKPPALWRRDKHGIKSRPAHSAVVLAEHACHSSPLHVFASDPLPPRRKNDDRPPC